MRDAADNPVKARFVGCLAIPCWSRLGIQGSWSGLRALLMLTASLLSVACAATPEPSSRLEGDYPGLLRSPEIFAHEFLWRQRLTANWIDTQGDSGSRSFQAVCEKQGPLLTLIGLSPFGSVGFVISQEGDRVEVRNETGQPLPFPPRFVLLDFQRAFFPWVSEGAQVLPDGEHSAQLGGEEVIETWSNGRLMTRRFVRLNGEPTGELVVHYTWGENAWNVPTHVLLDNSWFGYQLSIETSQEMQLESSE